tara:strand:+ start:33690 stop:36023 length:2334 start_codon:yes stop_codon:yes gene_type:complete
LDIKLKPLLGGGLLALMLTACGGGGGGGGGSDGANTPTPSTRELPQEMAAVVDQTNEFTNEFCPDTTNGQAPGAELDPAACLREAEDGEGGGVPGLDGVVARFCPVAAQSFDPAGLFDPAAFEAAFADPQGFITDGPLSFPVACLQESATNLGDIQELVGGDNPLTDQLCPQAAAADEFDPATCFSEVAGSLGGDGLPSLPGGGGDGSPIGGAEQICPEASQSEMGPEMAINCLSETTRVYITIMDMITNPNPVTGAVCPVEDSTGRVDPVVCFEEALSGGGMPSLPGLGDLPGLPGLPGGGDGGDTPELPSEFTDALSAICPDTLEGEIGPTTPVDCLTEAGGNLGGLTDLLGGLGGGNPLTDALCPVASGGDSLDPAACFSEALANLPSGGGGGEPQIPGTGMLLEQICPSAAAGELGPTTPIECLSELGSGFGGLEDLLGALGGEGGNPLTGQLCPAASEGGQPDPAACFMEALEGLPGALPLPGGDGGGTPEIPGADQLLGQICPATADDEIGPTTPVDCLTEAGGNLDGLQDLLGGLGGSNPLTDALCPAASGGDQLDPAACLTEALGNLPGAPGGDGGVPEIPGLGDGLSQICPNASAGEAGPTTPLECLMEAGGNFGQLEDLLGGLGGGNPLTDALCPVASGADSLDPAACFTEALGNLPGAPGGDGGVPEIPGLGDGLSQICPTTVEAGVGPTTPIDCLVEAGGNLEQLQDLLGGGLGGGDEGGDPITSQLCPEAGAGGLSPTLPFECLLEAGGSLPDLLTGLLGGLAP